MTKEIFYLSAVGALRFFGLFVALPAISLYYSEFESGAFLAGLAAGGYAVTQVIFQTPFGVASDKFDRKNVIIFGLLIFIAGSVVCAFADNIYTLIAGRFLQGAGAIGSVISAHIADLTREEKRAKAMAVMGAGIFVAFILAMIFGPLIAGSMGLNAIFALTAILNTIALLILIVAVPKSPKIIYSYASENLKDEVSSAFAQKNLLVMHASSFLQKFIMIWTFLLIGVLVGEVFDLPNSELAKIYAPAAVAGFLALGFAAGFAQKRGYYKQVMLAGVVLFALAYVLILLGALGGNLGVFIAGVICFFVGFSIHEPIMQTLASLYPRASQKGAVIGVFTTFGFVGSAAAALSASVFDILSLEVLCGAVVGVCAVWAVLLAFVLKNPNNHKNIYVDFALDSEILERLKGADCVAGVIEWYINETQKIAVVKYDERIISESELKAHLRV